jgi:hypothetical protein
MEGARPGEETKRKEKYQERPAEAGRYSANRERSKNPNNSKNHQWPPPTRVGIDAPRGERKKKKKLREEKSVKNTSSTCSIIRKMPQKPRESDLKIWYSSLFFYIAECEKISSNENIGTISYSNFFSEFNWF